MHFDHFGIFLQRSVFFFFFFNRYVDPFIPGRPRLLYFTWAFVTSARADVFTKSCVTLHSFKLTRRAARTLCLAFNRYCVRLVPGGLS